LIAEMLLEQLLILYAELATLLLLGYHFSDKYKLLRGIIVLESNTYQNGLYALQ